MVMVVIYELVRYIYHKLVYKTVYGRYNELVNGVYKPRYHWVNGILGVQTDWWFGT